MTKDSRDFGWALKELKRGKYLSRESWDPKKYLELHKEFDQDPQKLCLEMVRIRYRASIILKDEQNWQTPWIPQYEDLLAEDWRTVRFNINWTDEDLRTIKDDS